jgi:phosphate transport system substrate-binding protein
MKHNLFRLAARVLLWGAISTTQYLRAQETEQLPKYDPQQQLSGTIRSWGHVFLKKVMVEWEEGFHKYQPGIRFEDNLVSSAAATGALFTGTADLGILGREIRPMEVAGYTRVMKQKPWGIQAMTGSYANADKSVALGIFVSKENPLSRINFSQLDAIFGSEHLGGASQNIRTWGPLGLTGEWADRTIDVYAGELDAAPAFYFSQEVMKGSQLWNCNLKHYDDLTLKDGKVLEAQQRIVDALGADRYGIALSGAGSTNPMVKLIPVSITDNGPYVLPTPNTVADRTYPLARSVWIYINHAPGQPIDPKVSEFLRYILSREGQQAVVREGEYLPLTPALDAQQRRRLE